MLVKQNLSFQRETDVYSTDEVIHTCVNVTDMFRNRTEFEYTWLAGEHVTVTDTPCYDFRHTMVGTINITAWVKAKIPKYDGTMNYATEKEGHFAKTIILKGNSVASIFCYFCESMLCTIEDCNYLTIQYLFNINYAYLF